MIMLSLKFYKVYGNRNAQTTLTERPETHKARCRSVSMPAQQVSNPVVTRTGIASPPAPSCVTIWTVIGNCNLISNLLAYLAFSCPQLMHFWGLLAASAASTSAHLEWKQINDSGHANSLVPYFNVDSQIDSQCGHSALGATYTSHNVSLCHIRHRFHLGNADCYRNNLDAWQ